jgi:hypothetical protein
MTIIIFQGGEKMKRKVFLFLSVAVVLLTATCNMVDAES